MIYKKSLGQNFLTNLGAVSKIVDAGNVHADDVVLEIGPGKGVLTEKLLALAGKVVAVEKDDVLFALLQEKFKGEIAAGRLELVHGDILDFDIKNGVRNRLRTKNGVRNRLRTAPFGSLGQTVPDTVFYKLIANIPYNITGAILEKFLSSSAQPEQMVLLVQKEVAERIVARDHKESLLSISVKVYGTPRIVAKISAGSFFPKPNVDSAILVIDKLSKDFFHSLGYSYDHRNIKVKAIDIEKKFFAFLKTGFAHKRKLLSSNLKQYFLTLDCWKIVAGKAHILEKSRPENLSPEQWRQLFLESEKSGSMQG